MLTLFFQRVCYFLNILLENLLLDFVVESSSHHLLNFLVINKTEKFERPYSDYLSKCISRVVSLGI